MQMRFARALVCLLLGCPSMLAVAGATVGYPVTVNKVDGYAWGTLRDVRNTFAQGHQNTIWCEVGNGPVNAIKCVAVDAGGNLASCTADATTIPGYKQVIQSISSSSHIYFVWNPATEVCIDILVNNSSRLLDVPTRNSTGGGVTIHSASSVSGSLTGARGAPNTTEYLECGSWAGGSAWCEARDAAGETRTCTTSVTVNPTFVERVRSIDSASSLLFTLDPTTGACQSIQVRKGSMNLP
jgi:hypothetical protein